MSSRSAIFRDVAKILKGTSPAVLHCTHRLMDERHEQTRSQFTLRGPAETPAVVRLFTAGRAVRGIAGRTVSGETFEVDLKPGPDQTLRIRFPNAPQGAVIEIVWAD